MSNDEGVEFIEGGLAAVFEIGDALRDEPWMCQWHSIVKRRAALSRTYVSKNRTFA